jgi:hypothetical protein
MSEIIFVVGTVVVIELFLYGLIAMLLYNKD